MPDIWLKANTRAITVGMTLPLLLLLAGIATSGLVFPVGVIWLRVVGWCLAAAAIVPLGLLVRESIRPRLAYEGGTLCVYLRPGAPFRVPIDVVECFLLGQGPTMLPGRRRDAETINLIVRLAERAEDWSFREIKPVLGNWCGGYITLRGTWCEALSVALVDRLNARLHEVQRQRHDAQVAS